ncbi:MAG: response regulator, partial [Planctomycetota bacterium]
VGASRAAVDAKKTSVALRSLRGGVPPELAATLVPQLDKKRHDGAGGSENGAPRVLIVDDSSSMRAILSTIVTKLGYTVCGQAANGQEAEVLNAKDKPDIILLDINMPVKTGIEALPGLKTCHPESVVFMMTSVSDPESVQACLEAGAAAYILKSSTHEEIAQVIKETWEAGKAYD